MQFSYRLHREELLAHSNPHKATHYDLDGLEIELNRHAQTSSIDVIVIRHNGDWRAVLKNVKVGKPTRNDKRTITFEFYAGESVSITCATFHVYMHDDISMFRFFNGNKPPRSAENPWLEGYSENDEDFVEDIFISAMGIGEDVVDHIMEFRDLV